MITNYKRPHSKLIVKKLPNRGDKHIKFSSKVDAHNKGVSSFRAKTHVREILFVVTVKMSKHVFDVNSGTLFAFYHQQTTSSTSLFEQFEGPVLFVALLLS